MPIRFKDRTVNPHGLHQDLVEEILLPAERIFLDVAGAEVVITSVCDGVHSSRSFHYLLGAVDLRTKHLHTRDQKLKIYRRLDNESPSNYDILLESLGQPQEHLHAELDDRPKLQQYLSGLQQHFLETRLPRSAVMP